MSAYPSFEYRASNNVCQSAPTYNPSSYARGLFYRQHKPDSDKLRSTQRIHDFLLAFIPIFISAKYARKPALEQLETHFQGETGGSLFA